MAKNMKMEEKNLLKEITFLSRLIGQHKNKLKSQNVASSYFSQKTTENVSNVHKNSRISQNRFQNFKTTNLKYSKINHSVVHKTLKPSSDSSDVGVPIDQKIQVKKPSTVADVCVDETKLVKPEDFLPENISCSSSSVHINPNFLANKKNTQQELASLRCKSVHINPRVLGAAANNANVIGYDEPILQKHFLVGSSQAETQKCIALSKPANLCKSKSQSIIIPSQGPSEKVKNIHETMRTSTVRKKYVYQSKTKLIKAAASTPSMEYKLYKKSVSSTPLQPLPRTVKTPHGGTLLAVSRTKLVRLTGKTRRTSCSKSSTLNSSPYAAKFQYCPQGTYTPLQSPVVQSARKVSSKYRSAAMLTMMGTSKYHLDHRLLKTSRKGKLSCCRNNYKVDHRSISHPASSSRVSRVYSHLLISPVRRSAFSNHTWTSTTTPRRVQKVAISHKRLSKIGCNVGTRNYVQNSALVRIGGLFYKSSRTKLILSKASEKKANISMKPHTVVKRQSLKANHILYVRGHKFVMDQSGKALRRVTEDSSVVPYDRRKNRVSRVDIGGVTFIQKSSSILVRTNTHTARNVVSNAKQRSIAFLAKKMRKINTPCLFYRRFGRCPRLDKGRCDLVHDRKYVDICKKFLQGRCVVDGCLLSHDVGPEKMPTCHFFLEGCCVRDSCPYLHVKVNDRAPICHKFLQGYCADGPECLKRHILRCPEFDKKGSCTKGKYCPYPHSTAPRVQRALCVEPSNIIPEERSEGQCDHSSPKRKRYYESRCKEESEDELETPTTLKENRYYDTDPDSKDLQVLPSDMDTSEDDLMSNTSESPCNAVIRRPKIGNLPSFIALEPSELE